MREKNKGWGWFIRSHKNRKDYSKSKSRKLKERMSSTLGTIEK